MKPKLVPREEVERVLEALKSFYERSLENEQFSIGEFKEFMEPFFAENGYRSIETNPSGGGNVLLIHDSGVGDFVLTSPAIREIRRVYPSAHITLMIFPQAQELAEHCPYVDEVLFNNRAPDFNNLPQVYAQNFEMAVSLLNRRYDVAFAFAHYPSTLMLAYMSGARERIAHHFNQKNEAFEIGRLAALSKLVTLETNKWIYGTHSIENNLALLSGVVHTPIENREPEVWYTPLDRGAAEQFFLNELGRAEKIYALCMGGQGARKKWPPTKYARLAQMIVEEEPEARFMIFGAGEDDQNAADAFKNQLSDRFIEDHVLDLTDGCSYRVCAALLELCDMYIGNDTGTLHLAAAVKTPVLSPSCFSSDNPIHYNVLDIYYPYRVPSVTVLVEHALPECLENPNGVGCTAFETHCIARIEIEKMFAAYKTLKQRIAENNLEPLFVN